MNTENVLRTIAHAYRLPAETLYSWYGLDADYLYDPDCESKLAAQSPVFEIISTANDALPGVGDYALYYIATGDTLPPHGGRKLSWFEDYFCELEEARRLALRYG